MPARTNHEREELEDPLRRLLALVVGLRRQDLLADVLGHHQQHGQHQVGDGVVPADGRLPVDQREEPVTRALRNAGPDNPSNTHIEDIEGEPQSLHGSLHLRCIFL